MINKPGTLCKRTLTKKDNVTYGAVHVTVKNRCVCQPQDEFWKMKDMSEEQVWSKAEKWPEIKGGMGETPSWATMKSKKGDQSPSSPWPLARGQHQKNICINLILKPPKSFSHCKYESRVATFSIWYLISCVGGSGGREDGPEGWDKMGGSSPFSSFHFIGRLPEKSSDPQMLSDHVKRGW